jgi:transcriptional regulator with GAF, ATPase, and Fis domain
MKIVFFSKEEEIVSEIVKKLSDDITIKHIKEISGDIEINRDCIITVDSDFLLEMISEADKLLNPILSQALFVILMVNGEKDRVFSDDNSLNYLQKVNELIMKNNPNAAAKKLNQIIKNLFETDSSAYNIVLAKKFKEFGIIGRSRKIFELYKLVDKIIPLSVTVLLIGESGTGKELFAKAIHYLSPRKESPFIPIHCGAIPENLLEDELFGHVKGSFTGAINDKPGKFEVANGGTIFLDEISTMSPNLQVKLLRVLQEREITRIGSNKIVKVDVRIISASNQDLKEMVEKGEFREDLYYRLNVYPIRIPPLRERSEDIPILANHILKSFCEKEGIVAKQFSLSALNLLKNYDFPGNVRELENIVQRIAIISGMRKIILPSDIPYELREIAKERREELLKTPEVDGSFSLQNVVRNIEKKLILESLEKTGWNKRKAAELLKLKRTTLIEKIKKMNIEKTSLFIKNNSN